MNCEPFTEFFTPHRVKALCLLGERQMTKTEVYAAFSSVNNVTVKDTLDKLAEQGYIRGATGRNDPLRLTMQGRQVVEYIQEGIALTT